MNRQDEQNLRLRAQDFSFNRVINFSSDRMANF